MLARLGRWLRRRAIAWFPSLTSPTVEHPATGVEVDRADRRLGAMVVVVLVATVVQPVAGVGLGTALVISGRWRLARRRAAVEQQVVACVPDTIDLLRLAAEVGSTVRMATEVVALHGDGRLAEALGHAAARAARGARLADELERVRDLGPAVGPLVDALIAAERHGAPLVATLENLATDARHERRRRAEEAARRLPVALIFPLVLCILPALGVLTVVPLAAAALDGLSF
ncbi:MAG: type II secretion system F family protein [Acidimicrobiia bacterium]|nr:type II secretion system F family protein [Acidimicrobiia bacterium]